MSNEYCVVEKDDNNVIVMFLINNRHPLNISLQNTIAGDDTWKCHDSREMIYSGRILEGTCICDFLTNILLSSY